MKNQEINLPRPTIEVLNAFDQLQAQLASHQLDDEASEEVTNKLNKLIESYNWDNYEFTDPVTGKKGVKNPAGQIIVPAEYEAFTFVGDRNVFNLSKIAAKKDGKFGIVKADGSNAVLCDFRFDFLMWDPFTGLYHACWDGVKGKFGFVTPKGDVFIPNVLTKFYEPWNDFMLLEADGKFGALDTSTFNFVLPEYDHVDWEPDENVVFLKDGVEGYVVEDTGEFVPKEQFEEDEQYDAAYIFNTFINI